MPNENLFYFVRFSIFHQKSTINFSWNYVRFRRFFEFFQFNFPRNYVRFRRFLQKNFFTFIKDFREKIFLLRKLKITYKMKILLEMRQPQGKLAFCTFF